MLALGLSYVAYHHGPSYKGIINVESQPGIGTTSLLKS